MGHARSIRQLVTLYLASIRHACTSLQCNDCDVTFRNGSIKNPEIDLTIIDVGFSPQGERDSNKPPVAVPLVLLMEWASTQPNLFQGSQRE